MFCVWDRKKDRDSQSADTKTAAVVAGICKTLQKSGEHFLIGKGNTGAHGQLIGSAVQTGTEAGQPPMCLLNGKQKPLMVVELHGHAQKAFIWDAVELRFVILRGREQRICIINADFSTGIDSVLPFLKLNQPSPAVIIKIDWLSVK